MFSGSYVAIVTPMLAGGAIDFAAWERLLEFHAGNGTRGIVVGGTTGESPTLTDGELHELVVRAREQLRGRLQLLAGVGSNSTAATVERAARFGALGVDALLVVTPAYNKPTQQGLYLHFQAVAAASPVPLMLYNVPGRTAVDMLPPTVARLAQLPNIAAIKEAVADIGRIRELIAACGSEFDVLSGDDSVAREAVLAGGRGVVSVTANVAPRQMSELMAAALAGKGAEAGALDARLAMLHERLFLEANPIPVKWVMQQMGLIGPELRLPLTPLSERFHDRLREAMHVAGL
ncbi:MAG: 4-hydroxy-tetrahydrodipicolinate synthase [Sinobacteraceae bacterium]|nr:4-hydroxy-tetrahydrodipicolinate synthase [Nevskiaceae bacterium]